MSELISGEEALIYGVGVNNFDGHISKKGKHIYEYKIWKAMLRRCYSDKFKNERPTYNNCVVDNELLYFSKFFEFVRSVRGFLFVDGNGKMFHLDKDLLGCGKLYSRNTICFLPQEINSFLTNKKSMDSDYPTGVLFHKASGRLISQITIEGKRKYLGLFDNPLDAFLAYKVEKERYAKVLAEKYKESICMNAYNALMLYTVNIND